jgi:DNA-binding MarR family transcriptional regulator
MAKAGFTGTELYLVHEIVIRLDRIARLRILAPLGIVYPEFLVLMAARELRVPTQRAVGAHVDFSKSVVSQRVSDLRKKGLIAQTRNPANRRQVLLRLTARGNKTLDSAYAAMVSGAEGPFQLAGLHRQALHAGLAAVARALREAEGTEGKA